MKIDAVVSGRAWVQVEADGQIVFSGIVNSGDKKTWTGKKYVSIWSGNSSFLDITYNGKHLGPLGAPGEIVKEQWTAL